MKGGRDSFISGNSVVPARSTPVLRFGLKDVRSRIHFFFYRRNTRSLTQLETLSLEICSNYFVQRGIHLVCSFTSLETLSLRIGGYATLQCAGVAPRMSLSLTKVLVVLIRSKRSGQKLLRAGRKCNEFETSSNWSPQLSANSGIRVSVRLGYCPRDY
jgi:hypothetical protein